MPPEMSNLAKSIEYWREKRGISQAQLSAKAGLANSAVNDILRNSERSPRLATVEQLADALDISVWQLIAGPGEPVPGAAWGGDVPEGLRIITWSDMTNAEAGFLREKVTGYGLDLDNLLFGEASGWDSGCLGFLPGQVIAIYQAREYSGEVVAVQLPDGKHSLRYCAPPWLIGYRAFAVPFHEYMQDPSIKIVGAVRRIEPGRIGSPPPIIIPAASLKERPVVER